MFDLSLEHVLFTVIVAIVVIGPKDMPRALRTAGRWIGKVRRVSGHFRAGIETMIREAELEEMEQKWKEQNAAIMAAHPPTDYGQVPPVQPDPLALAESAPATPLAEPIKPKRKPRKVKNDPAEPAPKPRARKPKASA